MVYDVDQKLTRSEWEAIALEEKRREEQSQKQLERRKKEIATTVIKTYLHGYDFDKADTYSREEAEFHFSRESGYDIYTKVVKIPMTLLYDDNALSAWKDQAEKAYRKSILKHDMDKKRQDYEKALEAYNSV